MLKWVIVLPTLPLVLSTSGFANDSTAELATGGLIFTKSDYIEMQSEDLFISANEIKVRYQFFNRSAKNIITHIAFPMPDIPFGERDIDFAIPTSNPKNILGFTTTINRRPVNATIEQKAFVGGIDRTSFLRKLDVPVAPSLSESLDYLPQQTWDQLVQLGLAEIQHDSKDKPHLYPRWTLKTTYYWQQKFPARQSLLIDHSYVPSVGSTVPLSGSTLIDQLKRLDKYCIDKAFLTTISNRSVAWEQRFLEYILVTGANWSGPIPNFRLVVDKGSPDNLVSFCGQEVRKISSTRFEMRAAQFVPTANLYVLILTPAKPEPFSEPRTAPHPQAQDDYYTLNCDQLRIRRNSIFKSAGYCFHTPRAIRVFGNAGCMYDNQSDVPLSDHDRQVINVIQQVKRMKRCPQ